MNNYKLYYLEKMDLQKVKRPTGNFYFTLARPFAQDFAIFQNEKTKKVEKGKNHNKINY